jgi:CubicO group peptidase (beta-lactamase class C family)
MRGHRLVLARGYGVADREAGAPATAHTIYAIGSLSKQFTAVAIMKLYEEGRLQLDEPVTKYLPEFRASQTTVPTIRNLLQQNSGLPAWDDLPEFQDVDKGDSGRFELFKTVDVVARQPPLYRPGEWWSYSNSNYTVLAAVVERVTGTQHDEYLVGAFFDRLGLGSTRGCASSLLASAGQRAVGYQDSRSYAHNLHSRECQARPARAAHQGRRAGVAGASGASPEGLADRPCGGWARDGQLRRWHVQVPDLQEWCATLHRRPAGRAPTQLIYQGGREFATARPTDFRLRFEPKAGEVERVVWEWAELRAYGRRAR